MFRVLLPLDGSDFAERAVPHAVAFARALGGRLTLLHVVAPGEFRNEGHFSQVDWRLRKLQATNYLESAAACAVEANVAIDLRVEEGSPATVILNVAREIEADLLVMCTHGLGAALDFPQGGVTAKLLSAFEGSVLLVGPQTPGGDVLATGYRRLAVPIDGSCESDCALRVAAVLAERQGADLAVACVAQAPELPFVVRSDYRAVSLARELADIVERAAQRELEDVHAQLPPALKLRTATLMTGSRDTMLADIAARFEADLLVVSGRLALAAAGNTPELVPVLLLGPAGLGADLTRRGDSDAPRTAAPPAGDSTARKEAADGAA